MSFYSLPPWRCVSLSFVVVSIRTGRCRTSRLRPDNGRRPTRPAALRRARLRAQVVTRQAARSHLVTLGGRVARSTRHNNTLYVFFACFVSRSCISTLRALPPIAAPGPQLALRRRSPTHPAHGPLRAHCGVKTEGTARGFNPLVGCVRIHASQRSPLSYGPYGPKLLPGGTAAAPPRSSEKNRCALVLTQCTRALRLHPVRFGCYPGHRVTAMTHATCSPASSCLSVHTRLCKLLSGRDPSGVNP